MLTTGAGTTVSKENEIDWVRAHQALSRLARERAALDAEEGRWLLAALRAAAHVHLGFGSFSQYVERLFGYKPRSTQEKLRVAEALEELPATAAALERGALSWSAVRELTRVAVAETEESWLEVAQGKPVHQLEALVAGKQLGALPSSSPSREVRRHILRFEVAPETFCLFREAIAKIQRDSGASLDDDSALMLMARHVLGGPPDDGRASYQIALVVCPNCSQGYHQAMGELVPVAADVVTMGACDGQHLGPLPPAANTRVASSSVASSPTEGAALASEGHVEHAHAGAHPKAEIHVDHAQLDARGEAEVHVDDAHLGAHAGREDQRGRFAHPVTRAKQTVPPATRRTVLRRDRHRCCVPGCRNARFVDLHHLQLSSEGGSHDASNLITLCSLHHRAAHRGGLLVTGRAPDHLTFRHADGSEYGKAPDPRVIEVNTKAFAALRKLGFREGETRRVPSEVCNCPGEPLPSLERVLREAVAQLTSSSKAQTMPRSGA